MTSVIWNPPISNRRATVEEEAGGAGGTSTTEPNPFPEPRLLEKVLGIRLFEQRLMKLSGEGRPFGTVHTCIRPGIGRSGPGGAPDRG